MNVDLSVIILSYNTGALLRDCVNSLISNTRGITYELLIVDNASTEKETISFLKSIEGHKNTKIIRNSENLGFTGGNNVGIKVSTGKFILLLNSDTLIESNILKNSINWLQKNPDVGILTPALKSANGSFQMPGGFFPTLPRILSWMLFLDDIPFLGIKPYHWRPAKKITYVDWVIGAFFLIRREIVNEIGLLNEDFFMYVEDMEYCYRAKAAGWKVVYNPEFSITHLGGASSTKEFPILTEFKNVKLFFKIHRPNWELPILRIIFKIGSLLRIIVMGILKGTESAKIYVKAFNQV